MKLRSTETFWPIKNAMDTSYPSIDADITVPILIIGGGITGALIAYKLITEGKKVVLVDKRDICNGSTAASTALLQYEIDISLHELIEKRGFDCAVSSYKNCEKAIYNLNKIVDSIKSDCQFEFKKSIYFCSLKKDIPFLEREFKTRKENGFKVKWLEETDLKKLGLNGYAAIESEAGAVMDPYRLAHDLLKYCKQKGMQIFDRTNIIEFKHQKGKILALSENNFTITAEDIIHCSGYESTETLTEKIVDLKSTYALASESFTEIPKAFKNAIYWNTSKPYSYFRGTADNRIIMGGGDDEFQNPERRDKSLHTKEAYLLKQFQKCFPDINLKLDYSWAGTFGETQDALPYLGKPNPKKKEHYVLGFGGNGITFSVMAMDSIIASLNNSDHPDLKFYKFNR
ncbi:FAD-binding oxidoreductase [Flavobacterium sp. LS1R49]|uniref:FAD-binding oxidoreductase n=1 Tax=Flavobacterium shii TaxID=2987687 RepID=A0A9X3C6U5_9FLAO|nr:FAD-dependent oxidoreductase [Flavobacterium shii]MCV9927253.1 FAD-binding oxidoreductase [Flavobacterium shii]